MKLISFVVPCYNSEAYMEKCINSLIPGGDDVEIIIINDGSKDRTGEIADRFATKYPSLIKVIHQENGGHGAGVNAGLAAATGEYFKVVDSDDWVDEKALFEVIKTLKENLKTETPIDMLVANYVYEHVEDNTQNIIHYRGIFPKDKIFGWDEMIKIDPARYIIMHSVTYRTQILRDSGVKLPMHTFYVDNLVLYVPLPLTKNLYYLDVNFYRYYTGRADQSVNGNVMVKRIDQQIYVTELLLKSHDISKIKESSPKLAKYMTYYLSIMYTITSTLFAMDGTKQAQQKSKIFWDNLKNTDEALYRKIRYFSKAFFMALPGKVGNSTTRFIYRIARKVYKFN